MTNILAFKDYYQKGKIEFIEPESCAIIDLMNIKEEIMKKKI